MKKIIFVSVLIMTFASCSFAKKSLLSMQVGNESFNLFAKNESSKNAVVDVNSVGKSLQFLFSKELMQQKMQFEKSGLDLFLVLTILKNADDKSSFSCGAFLQDETTQTLVSQKLKGKENLVNIKLPKEVFVNMTGFFINAENYFSITSAKLVLADELKLNTDYLASENFVFEIVFDKEKFNDGSVEISFDNKAGDKEIFSIRPTPVQNQVSLPKGAFDETTQFTGSFDFSNIEIVQAFVLSKLQKKDLTNNLQNIEPIVCDPGLIFEWSKKNWRIDDFEIFAWEQLPSVLIFDFANYQIQDDYLKRLAFFVEKKGYTGRIVTNSEIADLHGFNAHDYRPESLAAFYNEANRVNAKLNEKEILLRDILLTRGIIKQSSTQYESGVGAIVSISQESPLYLRKSLLGHECYHGIYFTEEKFRTLTEQLYNGMDSKELAFLKSYFINTPSLAYNPNDMYLIKNEFMAYIVQQSVRQTEKYFASTLASRIYVNKFTPDLAAYVKNTRAASFKNVAKQFDSFLFKNWGLNAGRIYLVSKKQG